MSWYSESALDKTLFRYLRKQGWEEAKIGKLAKTIAIVSPVLIVIGVTLVVF